ncbi:MAG: glutamate-1-semialdehyde 2,1-aminomutase [Vicinamibacterales bacterium]
MTSSDWYARALATAPGGVHSPVRAFRSVGGTPLFVARADGARITDVEGTSYIDFCMSFGPLILGHRDPDVADAARAALDDGWSYGTCEPYSVQLAEWILERLPFVERVRFVSSGTEAVMSALRVARAATGRAAILKFDGCYHGHADAMLVKAGSGLAGLADPSSAGIAPGVVADTLVVPLDDDAALDAVFDAHGRRIAAAIIEPLPANYGLLPQRLAFLQKLDERCRQSGALLILDEVISGFRTGLTGMAGSTGITPDLACYGKVIGGGFPLAAYAGRADLMDLVAPSGAVYQAGTLSANPVAVRSGLAALMKMERLDGWRVLNERTDRFCNGLHAAMAGKPGAPVIVQQGSIFWLTLSGGVDRDWYARFFHHALQSGVYLPPSGYEVCFLSMAHDEATLERAADALVAAAHAAAQP